jgi:hypothetical protein
MLRLLLLPHQVASFTPLLASLLLQVRLQQQFSAATRAGQTGRCAAACLLYRVVVSVYMMRCTPCVRTPCQEAAQNTGAVMLLQCCRQLLQLYTCHASYCCCCVTQCTLYFTMNPSGQELPSAGLPLLLLALPSSEQPITALHHLYACRLSQRVLGAKELLGRQACVDVQLHECKQSG